jgi:peptide/nickel transport system substrate-binding protein
LLPVIPLYERFGANPAWEGVRIKAWPADDDPILLNSPYGDGIPIMLMYNGQLEGVE